MRNVLCLIGLHKWVYTPATYSNFQAELLGLPEKESTRTCSVCKKHQAQDVHCLGLNPPDYTYTWNNKETTNENQ